MKAQKSRIPVAVPALVALFGTACSLEPAQNQIKVTASLPMPGAVQSLLSLDPSGSSAILDSSSIPTPPSVASGFNCLGLNVLGLDVPSQDVGGDADKDYKTTFAKLVSGESYCSYAGYRSKPIVPVAGSDAQFEVTIPGSPESRLLQVVGVQDPTGVVCGKLDLPVGDSDKNSDTNNVHYYEIGRNYPFVTTGTTGTVSITNEWNSLSKTPALQAARLINCGDNKNSSGTTTPSGEETSLSNLALFVPASVASACIGPITVTSSQSASRSFNFTLASAVTAGTASFYSDSSCATSLGTTATVAVPQGTISGNQLYMRWDTPLPGATLNIHAIEATSHYVLDITRVFTVPSNTIFAPAGSSGPEASSLFTGLTLAQAIHFNTYARISSVTVPLNYYSVPTAVRALIMPDASGSPPTNPAAFLDSSSPDVTVNASSTYTFSFNNKTFAPGNYWLVFLTFSGGLRAPSTLGASTSGTVQSFNGSTWTSTVADDIALQLIGSH